MNFGNYTQKSLEAVQSAQSLAVENGLLSPVLGVIGCSCFWSILEIFEQKKRVEKGWFPMNPKRREEYRRK